jgi:hypothetical protein
MTSMAASTALELRAVDPLSDPRWDDRVGGFEDATIFHTSSWMRVLSGAYGFKPRAFIALENGRTAAVLPMMGVRDLRGRKKGVSLPFSDYCQPLFHERSAFLEVFRFAAETAGAHGWRALDLNGNAPFDDDIPASTSYYRHVLRLAGDEKAMSKALRESTRRNVKRAVKEGIEVSFESGSEALEAFVRLNALTRKRHGIPPQPVRFFRRLQDEIIAPGGGHVAVGRYRGQVIAASVYLHLGRKAFYKYGASDERFGETRANYLVMWEAIRRYGLDGYASLCLGRTEPRHEGLLQYKTGWGAEQEVIKNYRYLVGPGTFVGSRPHPADRFESLFRRLPVRVLEIIGRLGYKYMA